MKAGIHPDYKEINVICSCGNKFTTSPCSAASCTSKCARPATRSTRASRRSWTPPAASRSSASATARPLPPPRARQRRLKDSARRRARVQPDAVAREGSFGCLFSCALRGFLRLSLAQAHRYTCSARREQQYSDAVRTCPARQTTASRLLDFVSRHPLAFTCLLVHRVDAAGSDRTRSMEARRGVQLRARLSHPPERRLGRSDSGARAVHGEAAALLHHGGIVRASRFGWLLPLHDAARLATAFYLSTRLRTHRADRRRAVRPEERHRSERLDQRAHLLGCVGLLERGHFMITDISLLTGFVIALYGLALAPRGHAGGHLARDGRRHWFHVERPAGAGLLGIICVVLPAIFPQWRTRNYVMTLAAALVQRCRGSRSGRSQLYLRSPRCSTSGSGSTTSAAISASTLWARPASPGITSASCPGSLFQSGS